ncbi:MAG: hypothetical protein ILA04_06485 [Prevotella sp.]|nr:hypothetical protein [Prevotella sp.]
MAKSRITNAKIQKKRKNEQIHEFFSVFCVFVTNHENHRRFELVNTDGQMVGRIEEGIRSLAIESEHGEFVY